LGHELFALLDEIFVPAIVRIQECDPARRCRLDSEVASLPGGLFAGGPFGDASTDGSVERLKAFPDPRIRVLAERTPSKEASRQLATSESSLQRSRWIALLDADDRWHEISSRKRKLMAQASDRIGFIFTGWESVWSDGAVTRDAYSARRDGQGLRRLDLDDFVSAWLDLDACPVFPSGVVIRRDTLHEAGLFQERCRRGEDKEMCCECSR